MARYSAWLAALALLACHSGGAEAVQQVKSLYTAIDLADCRPVPRSTYGEARLCEGLPGYPIFLAEGELKTYLSVGQNAEQRLAARQTLSSFNTLFEKGGRRTTVEWRFVIRGERTVPYATIVRYFTRSATGNGEVLVVSRVTDDETCQVALVDALANADAIVLARKLADTVARSGKCPQAPEVQGAAGRSPM